MHADGPSQNRAIRREAKRLLQLSLPASLVEREDLFRDALGRDLCDNLQLELPKAPLARHLATRLLEDFGARGRAALRSLFEELLGDAVEAAWRTEATALLARLDDYEPPSVVVAPEAGDVDPHTLRSSIIEVVRTDGPAPHVSRESLKAGAEVAAKDVGDYLGRCIARGQQRPAVDTRFVALSLVLDRRQGGMPVPQGGRFEVHPARYTSLAGAVDDNEDCELVLVGAPGAGKSTLLGRLELELARAAALDPAGAAPLPFSVHLAKFGQKDEGPLEPEAWLRAQWAQVMPEVDFEAALAQRRFVFLLDALNEMPRSADATLSARIAVWADWLEGFFARTEGRHRVVFSCRTRDLSATLSTPTRKVRLLEIEPLGQESAQAFLREHAGEAADAVIAALRDDPKLAELYGTPLSLTLLLETFASSGAVPRSRAALFTAHLCYVLKREVERRNRLFVVGEGLLTEEDHRRLVTRPYDPAAPYRLPDDGPLFEALAALAYAMQAGDDREEAHVVLPKPDLRRLYDDLEVASRVDLDRLIDAGAALGLIGSEASDIAFTRQPHQEYLAARAWAEARPAARDYGLVAPPWKDGERDLASTHAALDEDAPLPGLPTTGWEETVLMGAEMARDDAVVRGLEAVHPGLAGRAAARRASAEPRRRLQARLHARCEDPAVDLRERIDAGLALAELGHPAFELKRGPHGEFIEPPMVQIPGGEFTMGEKGRFIEDGPAHTRTVSSFSLGRYPVTRAEFAYFVRAGGYQDPRWWPGEAAQRWFEGEGVGDGRRELFREQRELLKRGIPDYLTPPQKRYWREHVERTDEAFEQWLSERIEQGKQTAPWGFEEEVRRAGTQPVVGVCAFEVQAYLLWLNTQTGRAYRLPTEVEWERAARGLKPSRAHPWGRDLDPLRHANVYESHLRRLSPVGAFPEGRSPEGCFDLSGNVWEWTASPWTSSHKESKESDWSQRVVRGGSWFNPMDHARGACRAGVPLDSRAYSLGFRVCFPSPQSDL